MRRAVVLMILMLIGCTDSRAPNEVGAAPSETSGYFPPAVFQQTDSCFGLSRRPVLNEHRDAWYARHLQAADERPLSFDPGSAEALRFTWLRTFHPPVIVRVDWTSAWTATVTAKMLSGAGGYEPGTVSATVRRALTQDEIARLRGLRKAALRRPLANCTSMLDGAEWIVEATGASGYRYVSAKSPEKGALHDLGLTLLGFTGWSVEPIY